MKVVGPIGCWCDYEIQDDLGNTLYLGNGADPKEACESGVEFPDMIPIMLNTGALLPWPPAWMPREWIHRSTD